MGKRKTIKKTLEIFNWYADFISDRMKMKFVVTYNRSTKKYTFKEEKTNMMHWRFYLYEKTEEEMEVYLQYAQNFAEFFRMYHKEQSQL